MDATGIANHTSNIGADSLAYLKSGTGPAVIIVHGIGGHKEDWQEIMHALASRHTVYAIDMMGFGASSKACAEITIATQVGAISALMTAEKLEKVDLLGSSVGGWVAAQFAATYGSAVRRLVLVDAAGFKVMFEGPPPANFYPGTVEEMQQLLGLVLYSDFAHTRGFAEGAAELRPVAHRAPGIEFLPGANGVKRFGERVMVSSTGRAMLLAASPAHSVDTESSEMPFTSPPPAAS
jgi:pimeloyl-ACP methyl ester carboxylesterase